MADTTQPGVDAPKATEPVVSGPVELPLPVTTEADRNAAKRKLDRDSVEDRMAKARLSDVDVGLAPPEPPEGDAAGIGEPPTNEAVEPEAEQRPEAAPERTLKLKVNGQDVELTESEVIKRAQIVESAERRFQDAARMRAEAEAIARANQPQARPAQPETPTVTPEDRQIGKTLAYGNEEQAAQAVAQIRSRMAQPQQTYDPNEIARVASDRAIREMRFNSDLEKFGTEYKDVIDDPWQVFLGGQAAQQIYHRDRTQGVTRSDYEVFKEAGDHVRAYIDSIRHSGANGTPTAQLSERDQRKEGIPSQPRAAAARAKLPDNEPREKTASEIIAEERKARGLL